MSQTIEILLLLALPASGKSEIRRYLNTLSPERCRDDFRSAIVSVQSRLSDYHSDWSHCRDRRYLIAVVVPKGARFDPTAPAAPLVAEGFL